MSIASQLDIKAFFIGILSRIYNAIPEPETQYIIEDKNIHFIWIGSEIPLKYIMMEECFPCQRQIQK